MKSAAKPLPAAAAAVLKSRSAAYFPLSKNYDLARAGFAAGGCLVKKMPFGCQVLFCGGMPPRFDLPLKLKQYKKRYNRLFIVDPRRLYSKSVIRETVEFLKASASLAPVIEKEPKPFVIRRKARD